MMNSITYLLLSEEGWVSLHESSDLIAFLVGLKLDTSCKLLLNRDIIYGRSRPSLTLPFDKPKVNTLTRANDNTFILLVYVCLIYITGSMFKSSIKIGVKLTNATISNVSLGHFLHNLT